MKRKGQISSNVISYYRQLLNEIAAKNATAGSAKCSSGNTFDFDSNELLVNSVAASLGKEAVDVCRNQTASRLVEDLVTYFNWEHLQQLIEALSVHWELIVVDRFGNRVLETIVNRYQQLLSEKSVDVESAILVWSSFVDHMHTHYPEYLEHTYGSYSLRTYLYLISGLRSKDALTTDKSTSLAHLVDPISTTSIVSYKHELKDFCRRFLLSKQTSGLIESSVTGPLMQVLLLVCSHRLPKTFVKVCKHLLSPSNLFCTLTDDTDSPFPKIFTLEKSSYFIEQFISLLPVKQFRSFYENHIVGKETSLAVHPIANHVVHKLISVSDLEQLTHWIRCLSGVMNTLLTTSGLHGTVLSMAKRCNNLEGSGAAQSELVRSILRALNCYDHQKWIVGCLLSLSSRDDGGCVCSSDITLPGCLLLQELLKFSNIKVLEKSLLSYGSNELVLWCKNVRANHVMEVFVSCCRLETRQTLVNCIQDTDWVSIANDKYGSRVLDALHATGDLSSCELLAGKLLNHINSLRLEQFGKFAVRRFALDILDRRPDDWRRHYKEGFSKKRSNNADVQSAQIDKMEWKSDVPSKKKRNTKQH